MAHSAYKNTVIHIQSQYVGQLAFVIHVDAGVHLGLNEAIPHEPLRDGEVPIAGRLFQTIQGLV